MKTKKGAGLYSDVSSIGVKISWIVLIAGCIIGLGLVAVSIFLFFRKGKFSERTTAEVLHADCNKNNKEYACALDLQYKAKQEQYNSKINVEGSQLYVSGTDKNIFYNPDNPKDITLTEKSNLLAWILLFVGIIISVLSILHWFFVRRNRTNIDTSLLKMF